MAERRTLTEDEKKMLEGLAPFNVDSKATYIPKAYRDMPEDLRVVFTVRPFRKSEIENVRRIISNVKESDESKLREFSRMVITGMENLYDAATGAPIDFVAAPDGSIDRSVFDLIPVTIVSDVLMYVCRISGLVAAEKSGL